MTSNVRAADLSRDTEPFKVSRPKRADVEAAFGRSSNGPETIQVAPD